MQSLVDEGLLAATGRTKAREYSLVTLDRESLTLKPEGLEEHVVWQDHISSRLGSVSKEVISIAQYAFTEILNNAITHSRGTEILIQLSRTAATIHLGVADNGVGIFKKLKDELGLEDERHSILELAKGKLTTNPERHTGEGIFFTTRACDKVAIVAGSLGFLHLRSGDWLMDERSPIEGTYVDMEIDCFVQVSMKDVFDRYTSTDDDFGFSRTQIPVFLAKYGDENLVSRSQAKRVVARLERFREVVLDFDGVSTIGQAFADEIFRVFGSANPEIHLVCINASHEVEQMIKRARRVRGVEQPGPL
ncbi:MAG TPA: DUF4325 domain-containing protein [Gemmatimonadota bacterium]|nr:DUF4325 domain-containing protein [Gemmatimonadota bacterium]